MKIDFEYPSDESRHEDMEYDPTSDHTSDSSDFTESEEIDLGESVTKSGSVGLLIVPH